MIIIHKINPTEARIEVVSKVNPEATLSAPPRQSSRSSIKKESGEDSKDKSAVENGSGAGRKRSRGRVAASATRCPTRAGSSPWARAPTAAATTTTPTPSSAGASSVHNAQGKWRGGQYCCAVDCHNCTYRDGPRGVKFFRFPRDPKIKERWIKQVNRKKLNGSPWSPGSNARLCSEHFVSGKWSKDPGNPDYEPSIFPTSHVRPSSERDLQRHERARKRILRDASGPPARIAKADEQEDIMDIQVRF